MLGEGYTDWEGRHEKASLPGITGVGRLAGAGVITGIARVVGAGVIENEVLSQIDATPRGLNWFNAGAPPGSGGPTLAQAEQESTAVGISSGWLVRGADVARTFLQLVDRWRAETRFSSSSREIVFHPAYQRIIGLGPEVVPLILQRLKQRPEHWFWALTALTGASDVVPPNERGDLAAMTARWLAWGRQRGLVS
jgi:hypothetical protein